MAVLSLADAKTHLNIAAAIETHDDELTAVIEAAEAAIANRVGPLEQDARSDRVRVAAGSLVLPVSPAISLVAVTHADGTAVTVADLDLDAAAGIVRYADGVSSMTSGYYDVEYLVGRTSCPADLLMAVKELVRHLWETQRGPARRPGSTASTEAANTIPGAAYMFPFRVEQLLAPHLQPSVA